MVFRVAELCWVLFGEFGYAQVVVVVRWNSCQFWVLTNFLVWVDVGF